jgi:hypothetical protein
VRLVAIVIDPTTFGATGDVDDILAELQASRVPAYVVHYGDDLTAALSHQISTGRGPVRRVGTSARIQSH